MTIQQTLEPLMNGLPQDEAEELRALIQEWPTSDAELQELIETNTGEILQLFRQSLSSEVETHSNEPAPFEDTAPPTLPDFSSFAPLAHLN